MVRHYVSRDEMMLEKIFQDLRGGKSLFSACEKVNISTKDFYAIIEKKSVFREKFLCSLSDYADRCVDDIRDIVGQLKAGEIDNSTAKLLIETMKWMVNKVQSDIGEVGKGEEIGDEDGIKEIVVKFI